MAAGDLTSAIPSEFRSDGVVVLEAEKWKLAVVAESQRSQNSDKRWVWPAYVTLARAEHRCKAVLLVICPRSAKPVARWARRPIQIGHPGFELTPVVIDATNSPLPSDSEPPAAELAVLGALTGAIDLDRDEGRRLVLRTIAAACLEEDRLETYTCIIRAAASLAARQELEALMTTTFKDEWIDRVKAEGKAEGLAEGEARGLAEGEAKGLAAALVRVLAARGIDVPRTVRDQIRACTDLGQLASWTDRAASARSLDEVFAG
jgi:hypothetical protein